jgi:hypothetical protein
MKVWAEMTPRIEMRARQQSKGLHISPRLGSWKSPHCQRNEAIKVWHNSHFQSEAFQGAVEPNQEQMKTLVSQDTQLSCLWRRRYTCLYAGGMPSRIAHSQSLSELAASSYHLCLPAVHSIAAWIANARGWRQDSVKISTGAQTGATLLIHPASSWPAQRCPRHKPVNATAMIISCMSVSLSHCSNPKINGKDVVWFTVLEVSVHDQLALLLWASSSTIHYGRGTWQSKIIYMMSQGTKRTN